ncbi:MAG: hypothetical protein JW702_04000 [Clostridiales bacterium]|nr:hypothetical protein [Clostridiales bacterium]
MRKTIKNMVEKVFQISLEDFDIYMSDEARFGVFSTNVAFKLSPILKMSPNIISEKLSVSESVDDYILKAENGYLNFHLPSTLKTKKYAVGINAAECNDSDYFIYRLNFLKKRLETDCEKMESIELINENLHEIFVDFFLQNNVCKGVKAFRKYDRDTVYTKISESEKNNFYTIICLIVDNLLKNA